MPKREQPEPWLRGTLKQVPAVQRAVIHALELAAEDLRRWCGSLTDDQMNARHLGLPAVAFHFRHISRSLDRLLTYAEGRSLTAKQLAAMKAEQDPGATQDELFLELEFALAEGARRIQAFDLSVFEHARSVGKKELPASIAGLLVHVADHTQRHVGQAITTAKVVLAQPS